MPLTSTSIVLHLRCVRHPELLHRCMHTAATTPPRAASHMPAHGAMLAPRPPPPRCRDGRLPRGSSPPGARALSGAEHSSEASMPPQAVIAGLPSPRVATLGRSSTTPPHPTGAAPPPLHNSSPGAARRWLHLPGMSHRHRRGAATVQCCSSDPAVRKLDPPTAGLDTRHRRPGVPSSQGHHAPSGPGTGGPTG